MKILFTGGGTGGHIFPIIAIVREIRRISTRKDLQFFYIGPRDNFGKVLLSQEDIKAYQISAGKWRRQGGIVAFFQNVMDFCFALPWGIFQAFRLLFFLAPDLIFSKGGYGGMPVALASRFLGTPLFLHESDSVSGLANRFAARFALETFTSFPHTALLKKERTRIFGNPIRREILEGNPVEATRIFALGGGKPIILVLGGSQGAERINDLILSILDEMTKHFEVIHQTGEKLLRQVKAEAKIILNPHNASYYHPVSFLKETDLKHAYAICDFIISRAGAGSIFEIAAVGKPSILIPLPEAAQSHQIQNAYAYSQKGAAIVLEETNLTPAFFLEKVKQLFDQPSELERMSKSALDFATPDSAQLIAKYLLDYLLKV